MAYCGECGSPADGKFCRACGARVVEGTGLGGSGLGEPAARDDYDDYGYDSYDEQPVFVREEPVIQPRSMVAGALVAVVLGGAAIAAYSATRGDDSSDGAAAAVTTTAPPARTTTAPAPPASTPRPSATRTTATTSTPPPATFSNPPSATPSATPAPSLPTSDAQAIVSLNHRADSDEAAVPIDGSWVVQLDSKYVGVRDKSQQIERFTARDIWNRFQTVISDPRFGGKVRIVRDTHFGTRVGPDGKPTWIALLDLDQGSKASAQAWCEANFTERGKALANVCFPRQITPPRG